MIDDDIRALEWAIKQAVFAFERGQRDMFVTKIAASRMVHFSYVTGKPMRDFVGPLEMQIVIDTPLTQVEANL